MPVAVLLATWALGAGSPNMKVLFNVSFIVIGVVIASFGEIKFVLIGFLFQAAGILFEAVRLVMVQRLLSSAEYKMDPLVSLYYFAPVCAVMNACASLVFEVPKLHMQDIYNVGIATLVANAMVAFLLNVSVVFLVRIPPKLGCQRFKLIPMVDRKNIVSRPHPLRCLERHPPRLRIDDDLGNPSHASPDVRVQHRSRRFGVLQARSRQAQGVFPRGWPCVG